ncbi:hypothetical protein AB1Y20_012759 [Prymnesium parvum]|uniref:PX domain-containing protein n=1 Tax=Prymnesium parvum TaxID=97485 RepID=A0AB34IJD0_PRYPA
MMDSANPFAAPTQSDDFYEQAAPSAEGGSGGAAAAPPPAAPPRPPEPHVPPSTCFATPPSNFGEQAFQDLDLSGPVAPSNGGPAARFDSKALEAGSLASGARVSSPDLAVTVSNPSKQGEGMSAYFTYTVTTRTSLPQYQCGQFSVSRRFRDFDWLHTQLANKYPGAIVPALPEKQDLKNASLKYTGVGMSAELLEQRRAQLQRFMQRVAAHPLLHSAQDLQTFLEASDVQLESWKESTKLKAPALLSTVADVKQGAYSSASRLSSYFTSDGPPSSFEPVSDVPLMQMANYSSALQTQVQAVHKNSKNYIERHNSLSSSMTSLGLALTQLANCEGDASTSLAEGLSQMGVTVDRVASLYNEQAAREKATFDDPLKDYVRLLSACKQAINCRDAALRAYNNARATAAAKKDKLEKLRAAGGKEDKANVVARELSDAEENVRVAKQDYESVAARLDADMVRFQREKLADFKQYIVGFVSLQLEYSQSVQAQWRELLPRLEAIDPASSQQ